MAPRGAIALLAAALLAATVAVARAKEPPPCGKPRIADYHPLLAYWGGWVGKPFSKPLEATGGSGKYFWQITSGSLAAGLTTDFPTPPRPGAKYDRPGASVQHVVGKPTQHGRVRVQFALYDWPNFPGGLACEASSTATYTIVVASTRDRAAAVKLLEQAEREAHEAGKTWEGLGDRLQQYLAAKRSFEEASSHVELLISDDTGNRTLGEAAASLAVARALFGFSQTELERQHGLLAGVARKLETNLRQAAGSLDDYDPDRRF